MFLKTKMSTLIKKLLCINDDTYKNIPRHALQHTLFLISFFYLKYVQYIRQRIQEVIF